MDPLPPLPQVSFPEEPENDGDFHLTFEEVQGWSILMTKLGNYIQTQLEKCAVSSLEDASTTVPSGDNSDR